MKKLLVSAVAVAALAAPAMAQEFVPAEYQNSAMVEQIGTANEAIVNQTWLGLFNGQALAEVTQEGRSNRTNIAQRNAGSNVFGAFNNKAMVEQVGRYSGATIRQIHDHDTVAANEATILQYSNGSVAFIGQRGDANLASITQGPGGRLPRAYIGQNGTGNSVGIEQYSDGGNVTVNQGTYNATSNPYSSDSADNEVTIYSAGVNPLITVTQLGQGNVAVINEDGVDGTITVNSSTFLNSAYVDQYSTSGTATIDQVGAGLNMASIWQASTDVGSAATINQTGIGGTSSIEQRDSDLLGGSNTATSNQSGSNWTLDSITSSILQDGTNNTALVNQAGSVAASTIQQVGSTHSANVSQ